MAWIKARLKELTTKIGIVLTAISTIAPQYAAFDTRFAYAGAVAGFILMVVKERPRG